MIVNIVSLLVLVLLVVLFAWLATRAWRAKRAFVKWPGVILAGLLTLVFAAVTVVAVLGFVKLEARHANPVADLKVAGTAEQIARGGQLAWGCADCHSPAREPPLGGSTENYDFRRAARGCALGAQSDARRAAEGLDGRRDRARDPRRG